MLLIGRCQSIFLCNYLWWLILIWRWRPWLTVHALPWVTSIQTNLTVENVSEELHSSICLSVLCNLTLTSCCGNHFCQGCVPYACLSSVIWPSPAAVATTSARDVLRGSEANGKPCLLCQSQDYATMLDKPVMRRVKQLKVQFPNKNQGCMWIGELDETWERIGCTCDFVEVACSFLCGTTLPCCHLSVHEANLCRNCPYTCPYCNLHDVYAVIAEEHWPQCASYRVECLNGCGVCPVKHKDLPNSPRWVSFGGDWVRV